MYYPCNFSTRKSCILLVGLLCMIVLAIYITSERQLMAFYNEESMKGENIKTNIASTNRDRIRYQKQGYSLQKHTETTSFLFSTVTSRTSPVSLLSYSATKSPIRSSHSPRTSSRSENNVSFATVHSSKSSYLSPKVAMTQSYAGRSPTNTAASSSSRNASSQHAEDSQRKLDVHQTQDNSSRKLINELEDYVPVSFDKLDTVMKIKNDRNSSNVDSIIHKLDDYFENYEKLHKNRVQQIKHACSNKQLFENKLFKVLPKIVFYKSDNYNFSYCKVPKSGSTFWTKAFGVLKHGLGYGDVIFKESRRGVHNTMLQYMTNLQNVINEKSRTILVSRDPYSRLFSAYIDKSYLLLMKSLNHHIRHIPADNNSTSTTCPTNVTFQEFLDWIVAEVRQGKALDRHWAPVFSLCQPCKINSFILVKQETFARDVEFALEQVGVEKDKIDYITLVLHDHRAEISLPGIIDMLFITASGNIVTKKCLSYSKFAKRVWISLQIQGFIDKQIDFPYEKINQTETAYSKYFTEIVLQTLKKFPLTSYQSKVQRYQFLRQAYKAIGPETIRGIQELYKQDFALFGYSFEPPT